MPFLAKMWEPDRSNATYYISFSPPLFLSFLSQDTILQKMSRAHTAHPGIHWETDIYPVQALGRAAFSLCGCQTPAQHWIKILHPWVQEFYPVLGLGSEKSFWGMTRLQHYAGYISICDSCSGYYSCTGNNVAVSSLTCNLLRSNESSYAQCLRFDHKLDDVAFQNEDQL